MPLELVAVYQWGLSEKLSLPEGTSCDCPPRCLRNISCYYSRVFKTWNLQNPTSEHLSLAARLEKCLSQSSLRGFLFRGHLNQKLSLFLDSFGNSFWIPYVQVPYCVTLWIPWDKIQQLPIDLQKCKEQLWCLW